MRVKAQPEHEAASWLVPVPPPWEFDESLWLHEIVPDASDEDVGDTLAALLWRQLRILRKWAVQAEAPPSAEYASVESASLRELRTVAAAQAPELATAIRIFGEASRPGIKTLVAACRQVVQWAEDRGWSETAMRYAEAAAELDPENPEFANLAGRVCRRGGQRARAEIWYQRAIALARAKKNAPRPQGEDGRARARTNVREYVSAHLGYSAVLRDSGRFAEALRYIRRAGQTAKRAGMRGKAAEAFHDATFLATLRGDLSRATLYARRALAVYPRHHLRFPAFGHDLALLLLERGMYSHALSLLSTVVVKITAPAERLVVMGTLARAAAGVGYRLRYTEVARRVQEMAPQHLTMEAGAIYNIAEGARLLNDWESAARLAGLAVASGRVNDQPLAVERAERLLRDVAALRPGISPLSRHDARGAILRKLAAVARLLLRRWRGPTWRPRRQV